MLNIEWIGRGGSANLSLRDFLATDEDILWPHSRGYYRGRPLHISL